MKIMVLNFLLEGEVGRSETAEFNIGEGVTDEQCDVDQTADCFTMTGAELY